MDNDAQISELNTLITTLIDSINGYQDGVKNTDNPRFKQIFEQNAQGRRQAVEQLRSEVRRLGGDPSDDGSFMGKAHQRWFDLKASIAGQDDKAVINTVESGEDYLKDNFETALKSDKLSGEARAAVERAYQSVRSGHDEVSSIKHQMEATS